MGVTAYMASVLPYYWYPQAIGIDKEAKEAAKLLPSVRKLYTEYEQLRKDGHNHPSALSIVRQKDPETAALLTFNGG